ncbi:ERF family protein [Borreliella japonica]|uniref:ERF family protein n=1 Tax=Borreliella japonica TaxID=34095 RepID=UPI003AEF66CA
MTEVSKNNNLNIQDNMQNNIQAEIKFLNDMDILLRNLPRIDKSLPGHKYMYQDFNDIVEEIYSVIEKHNLDLMFRQFPISIEGQYGIFDYIRTTFFSKSTGYRESFDTRIHIDGSKNMNSIPQQVGSAITYFKRYALVACLNIRSEVDTDADPNYNNYENKNFTPNRQVSFNRKQEQKQEINYNQKKTIIQNNKTTPFKNQKKDSFYHYGIFKEALSNIKNWVNDFETKDNINSIIQKISFIQNIDPNDDDIKKIEDDLKAFITKNAELKSPMFWAGIIRNHFKKTNRLKDLKDFDERFTPSDQRDYNDSPLIFFDSIKEDKQFDYIFAS